MPRTGELLYYTNLGADSLRHAINKPFSDSDCGLYLLRVGALTALLPPPPARVLDCGCGTGWLSYLLQKRGYAVVGTDVAPDAIRLAQQHPTIDARDAPHFLVADSEQLTFDSEFDAVIFFDSLHHAVDEQETMRRAYRALKPGGVCITLEPGHGHNRKSRAIAEERDVTEKDMPPSYIRRLGRAAGFERCEFYPAPDILGKILYAPRRLKPGWTQRLLSLWPLNYLAAFYLMLIHKRSRGIVVLHKRVYAA